MVKILAVDDRPENLLALAGVLDSPLYEVIPLRSGEEALRYLLMEDVSEVAVILMDVQMPGTNGFETVKLIKQRERCREIPVVFLTAISTSADHVMQGYHAGSIDYLFKPVDPDLLRLKVDAFVKLHTYHRKIAVQSDMLRNKAEELETANGKLADAESLLKSQNERLEAMVAERTLELRSANEKLLKSQERFKTMFMSSPCLISIRRLSDSAYIDVNESWMHVTGYGAEVIGQCSDVMRMEMDHEHEEARLDKPLRNVSIKYSTKAGEPRDGLLSTEIMEIDEEKCLLEVVVDVTEKALFEKEMARLSELYLIGEMAAGIAHEIRNPMTTIRGFLQLSQSTGGRIEKDHLDMMLAELDRAHGIITEYLSLAKNKQADMRPAELDRIVESIFPLLQAEAIVTGKRIVMECVPCPELLLDEKEIRQLVLNISLNGLEAMSPGGVLTIRVRREQDGVVLHISDQGRGISQENMDKLGRPFFTTKDNGTGLGLAVCYSIAARHRAVIHVASSSTGTEFTIRFPMRTLAAYK